MNKNELISIIVPVFNVEKYLNRCVESLVSQTYENVEIVLVNDGSTDKSGFLCDELSKNDRRISVIHKKNGGLSSARNAGIAACKGSYVGFVDSDDWVSVDMYNYLAYLLQENNADLVQINLKQATVYSIDDSEKKENIIKYIGKDILQNFMFRTTVQSGNYSVCRCLFKKNVIAGIEFREGKINEDIDFKYKALSRCKVYVESNLVKYYYFQSTGSLTTSGLRKKDFDLYEAAEELYKLTSKESYGNIEFLGRVKKARTSFSLLSKIAYYGIDDATLDRKKIINQLTRDHRNNLLIILKSPMKINRKIIAILLAINIKALELPLIVVKLFKTISYSNN